MQSMLGSTSVSISGTKFGNNPRISRSQFTVVRFLLLLRIHGTDTPIENKALLKLPVRHGAAERTLFDILRRFEA